MSCHNPRVVGHAWWRRIRFEQPRDVLVPLTIAFAAVRVVPLLLANSQAETSIRVSELVAIVGYSAFAALLGSVRFPAKDGLVAATGMVVTQTARDVSVLYLARGVWTNIASVAAGAVAVLALYHYVRRHDARRAAGVSATSGGV